VFTNLWGALPQSLADLLGGFYLTDIEKKCQWSYKALENDQGVHSVDGLYQLSRHDGLDFLAARKVPYLVIVDEVTILIVSSMILCSSAPPTKHIIIMRLSDVN